MFLKKFFIVYFQITQTLHSHPRTRNVFENTYAANTLPDKPVASRPVAYVVNLSPLEKIGSHWICMYFPKVGLPEYFDTFVSEVPSHFEKFMGEEYKRNLGIVQHPLTTSCGQHVIFYIFQRCNNKTMEQILAEYSDRNLLTNDVNVTLMVNKNFRLDLKLIDFEFLKSVRNKTLL